MIKVLAVSHAYVEPFTRAGLVEAGSYPDIELSVVVPAGLAEKNAEGYKKLLDENYKVYPLKSFLNFHQSLRFYGLELITLIKKLKPNIIFINNEPWSLTAFQISLISRSLEHKPKLVVYTCENLKRYYYYIFKFSEKYVLKHIDLVFTMTKKDGPEILREKGFKNDLSYLPLSVDTDNFKKFDAAALRSELLKGEEGIFLIGYVGRIVKEKGIDQLIEALRVLPGNCRFLIIGNGGYKTELIKLCRKYGLERKVLFVEGVLNSGLPRYLNCLDVLALPSLTTENWKEQFGRVLIEAMACEVSVVGSDSGEIPEVIGDAGLAFKEGDKKGLAGALMKLRDNKELRASLGARGRQRVLKNYEKKLVMARTASVYRKLYNNENIN